MNNLLAHADTLTVAPEVSINWLAVVLATVAAMAIGYVWYGPLFGKQWMKLVGMTKKDIEKASWTPMYVMLVMAFIQAYILSHFIIYASYFYPDLSGVVLGLITGFWAWVGFSGVAIVSNHMFSNRSNELIKIDAGSPLVTLLITGAIIGAFL